MKQIFVSSTFKDMHLERDLIQTKLSPDLNEKAYQKRIEGINSKTYAGVLIQTSKMRKIRIKKF